MNQQAMSSVELLHGQLAVAPGFLGHVRVEGEAAHHQQVEPDAHHGFLGRFLDQLGADGAMLRADAHGGAPGLALGVRVRAGGVDPLASVRIELVELEPLALLGILHAGLAQVVEDHALEGAAR
jgi:hypothetical protein